jgi:hypothetical protein
MYSGTSADGNGTMRRFAAFLKNRTTLFVSGHPDSACDIPRLAMLLSYQNSCVVEIFKKIGSVENRK